MGDSLGLIDLFVQVSRAALRAAGLQRELLRAINHGGTPGLLPPPGASGNNCPLCPWCQGCPCSAGLLLGAQHPRPGGDSRRRFPDEIPAGSAPKGSGWADGGWGGDQGLRPAEGVLRVFCSGVSGDLQSSFVGLPGWFSLIPEGSGHVPAAGTSGFSPRSSRDSSHYPSG